MDTKFTLNLIASYISIITGVIGTIVLFQSHPFLAGISTLLIISGFIFIVFQKYLHTYIDIRRGIKRILEKLKEQNISPDLIISFTRSGATVAGMLAVNLGVEELLIFSPKLNPIDNKEIIIDKLYFTPYITLNGHEINKQEVLLVFMGIDTGETVRVGINLLKESKVNISNLHIATIYINPGFLIRSPHIIYAYKSLKIQSFLNHLPWIIDEYHHH